MTESRPEMDSFANDERVHYDQQLGKWIFEEDDRQLEWDQQVNQWVPHVNNLISV